jgi:hypothetical protein
VGALLALAASRLRNGSTSFVGPGPNASGQLLHPKLGRELDISARQHGGSERGWKENKDDEPQLSAELAEKTAQTIFTGKCKR